MKTTLAYTMNAEMRGSLAALERAATMARQIAIQTDTAIVVVRDGKTVRVPAAELRKEQSLATRHRT